MCYWRCRSANPPDCHPLADPPEPQCLRARTTIRDPSGEWLAISSNPPSSAGRDARPPHPDSQGPSGPGLRRSWHGSRVAGVSAVSLSSPPTATGLGEDTRALITLAPRTRGAGNVRPQHHCAPLGILPPRSPAYRLARRGAWRPHQKPFGTTRFASATRPVVRRVTAATTTPHVGRARHTEVTGRTQPGAGPSRSHVVMVS